MFGFGEVFNRKPRKFQYRPRYYDPDKEARDRRRIELGLEPLEEAPAKPGDRLRAKRMMHEEAFAADSGRRRKRNTVLILVILVFMIAGFYLIFSI